MQDPPQLVWPEPQVTVQVPAEQTFPDGQAVLQVPQWLISVCKSTQEP